MVQEIPWGFGLSKTGGSLFLWGLSKNYICKTNRNKPFQINKNTHKKNQKTSPNAPRPGSSRLALALHSLRSLALAGMDRRWDPEDGMLGQRRENLTSELLVMLSFGFTLGFFPLLEGKSKKHLFLLVFFFFFKGGEVFCFSV